ncbi:M48 family metalloprotease [Reyranella sp.]|uniref:M48 family metallopeptidase n=1 Tax=Reyranella sp. TaxID=1929291 RepID=UPI003BAA1C19
MRRWALIALSGTLLVGGCSGAVHRLPQVSDGEVAAALAEVRAEKGGLMGRPVSDGEVRETLRSAIQRVREPALQVCHEMNVGPCTWQFRISRDHALNASAMLNGLIVLNRGLVEHAANEEEICLAIAHEISHQAANHVVQGLRNQMIGAAIGAVVLGAGTAVATSGRRDSAQATRSAAELGMQVGAMIGRLSFSKEQEREADYLAALILYRAGVDLEKARGLLVGMARESRRTTTTMFDSHPVGPERLAAWDRAVAEVRASGGSLPPRAK